MQIKTKYIVDVLAVLVVFAAFSIVGQWEQEDAQAASEQAQYVKALAQQDDDERKAEFNRIEFEGERMTGFAGDIK